MRAEVDAIHEVESTGTSFVMSTGAPTIHLTEADARRFCDEFFSQLGMQDREIADCTDILVETSLRGVDSHGIALVATFAERIRSGQMRPGCTLFVRREAASTAWVDGQQGMGPSLARRCVHMAMDKARRTGIGAISLADGNYVGALAPYLLPIAEAGFFGLAAANSTPRVAPLGGREGVHGTNPIAWIAPVVDGDPLLFDAATGHAAARIRQAADEGRPLAPGIALDADGNPTTDPAAATAGTLLPVGGALGFGLGLLVGVLTGGLADGPVGTQVPPVSDWSSAYGASLFILVVDPAGFGGVEAFSRRCADLCTAVQMTEPMAGGDPVRSPGERARMCRQQRQVDGIPMSRLHWEAVLKRLADCDLDLSRWDA